MMHSVHDSIGPWTQIGGALGDIGENKEKALPEPAHYKCAMRSKTMLKERLRKKRKVPDGNKKDNNS